MNATINRMKVNGSVGISTYGWKKGIIVDPIQICHIMETIIHDISEYCGCMYAGPRTATIAMATAMSVASGLVFFIRPSSFLRKVLN